MSFTSNTPAAATTTSPKPSRRPRRPVATTRRTAPHVAAHPLHEALALGLGCHATGYRLTPKPEWQ